jgi:hypothetical protein
VSVLRKRGIGPGQLACLIVFWPSAALLAWTMVHVDPAKLAAHGTALGMDGHAYWVAWRHPHLYGLAPRANGAYLYSPAFAQLIWPLTLLPFWGFAALWWGAIVAAFLWLLRPLPLIWRAPLLVLTGFEIQVGNVHAFLAVMIVLALRWPGVWCFAILTKITPAVGLLWFLTRREWRSLAHVCGVTIVVVSVSAVLAPQLWHQWMAFLLASRHSPAAQGLLNTGSLAVRVVLAGMLTIWGARTGRPWVLAVAVPLATPLVGPATLTILAAMPRLIVEGQQCESEAVIAPSRRLFRRLSPIRWAGASSG